MTNGTGHGRARWWAGGVVLVVAVAGAAAVATREDRPATTPLAVPTASQAASATPTPTPARPSPSASPTPASTVPETFVAVSHERIALFSTESGRRLRYLTAVTEFGDSMPMFSADRSRVYFSRRFHDCDAALMEVRPDGTGLRTVIPAQGSGPIPAPGVDTVRGLAHPTYDCAEGYGSLGLRDARGRETSLANANALSTPGASSDGRYVYVLVSRANYSLRPEDFAVRWLRRIDVTRRTPDVVVEAPRGCEWEGSVVGGYLHGGRPSVVAGRRCGNTSSLVVADEGLRGVRELHALGGLHVGHVGIDPSGRHLLLHRTSWNDRDDVPDLVQYWSGDGEPVTIAEGLSEVDW